MERWHSSVMMKSKFLDGEGGVIFDWDGFLKQGFGGFNGEVVKVGRRFLLAFQHRVNALDGSPVAKESSHTATPREAERLILSLV